MTATLDVLIIGAGFSGCYQLYRLRQLGFNVKLYDAGTALGGVWHWNCYPGARVDSHVPNYEFSLAEVWKDWRWSERFPAWQELRAYFEHVDQRLDLSKDVRFSSRIVSAEFDEAKRSWMLECDDGHRIRTRYLLPCVGFASQAYIPDLPGLDSFAGPCHHTARWPQAGLSFADRKVGVIGTGASGVQVIQEASKVADSVTVFQRTPMIALPMQQQTYTAVEYEAWKQDFPEIFQQRDASGGGLHDINPDRRPAWSVSDEERRQRFEAAWQEGGFQFWSGTYGDILSHPESNRLAYDFWRDKTRARLADPSLHEKLAPMEPLHPFGAKRPSLEQGYYECFNQDNVELVELKKTPIESIAPAGVKLDGRQIDLDILVLATGFDGSSGGLTRIDLRGADGTAIADTWQHGVRTWLGIGVPNFPNMLMLYGPQSPTAFWNGPTSAEVQGDWVVDLLCWLRETGMTRIEATTEAAEDWNDHMNELADATLLPQADSWYMGANIPGKPRQLLHHSGVQSYLRYCAECKSNDYAGFDVA